MNSLEGLRLMVARNGINQAHFCREVETMDGTDKWKNAQLQRVPRDTGSHSIDGWPMGCRAPLASTDHRVTDTRAISFF